MDPLLSYLHSQQENLTAFLRALVECESPSDDAAAVNRLVDLLADRLSPLGKVKTFPGGSYGRHFQCEFHLPGRKKSGRILALGHSDTVYPVGTLATMPFQLKDGRLWGPGVLDMKAGVAFFVYAMLALRELDRPVARRVVMQLNSDEEVGSPSSRVLTEREARESVAVLVLEPGAGPDGNLKTARKGTGDFTLRVRGKAAHAGLDFASGASAIVELAWQIERIAGFTKLERGVTVNPGVIRGGSRVNVVAGEAEVHCDLRFWKQKDAAAAEKRFRALKPVDKRCSLSVEGGVNRPPLERTQGVAALFRTARRLAGELGVTIGEAAVGGGSDGNFTAALGVPTLDGLGGVGDGAHAPHEHILADRMADRAALMARLVETI